MVFPVVENLLFVAQAIVAVLLIIVVLLQRSEGGMGALGGSGANALMSGQSVSNTLEKATKILAAIFVVLCLAMASLHMGGGKSNSVVDRVNDTAAQPPMQTPVIPEEDTHNIQPDASQTSTGNVLPAMPSMPEEVK